jgi:hypothetical protein
MSEVNALDLSCSMAEQFGLNLAARDLLKGKNWDSRARWQANDTFSL